MFYLDQEIQGANKKKRGAPKKENTKKGYSYRLSLRERQAVNYLLTSMRSSKKNIKDVDKYSCISNNYAVPACLKQFYAISTIGVEYLQKGGFSAISAYGIIKETNKSYHLTNHSAYESDFENIKSDKDIKPLIIDKNSFKLLKSPYANCYYDIFYPSYKRALAALLFYYKADIISKLSQSADNNLINNFLHICSVDILCTALEYAARSLNMDYFFKTDGLFVEEEFKLEKEYFNSCGQEEFKKLNARFNTQDIMY